MILMKWAVLCCQRRVKCITLNEPKCQLSQRTSRDAHYDHCYFVPALEEACEFRLRRREEKKSGFASRGLLCHS